ncbi:major facilitator superfamily domain-containing protein [Coniella lustricola]|uniref:Major facilitator superfamily domain-containing protein n=1 Tax=Coniella lustricola TaxID=2025994 RepID=A0A2T3AI57_9PEZI|nr:major facilitator superfamily domain-containing protein [Coniella lustricola]
MTKSASKELSVADNKRNNDVTPGTASRQHQVAAYVPDEKDTPSQKADDVSQASRNRERSASPDAEAGSQMHRIPTSASLGPDQPVEHYSSYVDVPDSVYDRFSERRKIVIVMLLSVCSFLAPISSTTVLSATPEVAAEYKTTGTIVNISNAMYMLFMGISPVVWGPLSEVWGRKWITRTTAILFFLCSIATALAPNLAAFFVFRILTALEGTAFLLVGSACLQDIYRPTERATAMGWFLSGTLVGPAIGPCIGGIIVTYTSWRVIFWLQSALAGLAAVGTFVLLPETIHHRKYDDLVGLSAKRRVSVVGTMINPWRVLKLMTTYPNLFLSGIATSSLVWNMYSLLTPIRYVINPRFHLTTPLQGGLFYLAPGAGYLLGTFIGGRYADYVVKKYIRRSNERIPEDRLRSALPFLGFVIPVCVLVYGWCVEMNKGGIPVVVIMLFIQGVAQLFCFPSLNTYCLDVMQGRGSDVIAGNYFIRYCFAAAGTAVVLPAIEKIGVGAFSTISASFMVLSALGTAATVKWGRKWREVIDAKRRAKRGVGKGEKGSEAAATEMAADLEKQTGVPTGTGR